MGFVSNEVKERNLAALARNKGFQFTDAFFPYTSGKIGPYFVQSGAIMANGNDFAQACDDMARMIVDLNEGLTEQHRMTVITGGETRDWIFSQAVAKQLRMPHTMIYKAEKMVGADLKGRYVAHVADLNNEGSSFKDYWKPKIQAAGGYLENAFFFIDRMEEGVNVLKSLNVGRLALVELDAAAWDYLQRNNVVSADEYRNLQKRTENPEVWAAEMLRSRAGLQTLVALLGNGDNREKAKKILNVGYPHLKDEISGRLVKEMGLGVKRWLD